MLAYPAVLSLWRSLYGPGTAARPEVEMCGPLAAFLDRLPPGHNLTAEAIIQRHTLVPYYTFSRSAHDASRIKQRLSDHKSIRTLPRVDVWKLNTPEYLQFCPKCVETDLIGPVASPYWRRSHQLLGVVVCPDHGVPLFRSEIGRHKDAEPRDFISLAEVVELGSYSRIEVRPEYLKKCLQIAEDTLWILKDSKIRDKNLSRRHKDWCLGKGWYHKSNAIIGTIKYKKLRDKYNRNYESEFLSLISEGGTSLNVQGSENWLRRLYSEKYRRTFHPLQHILGWRLIDLSASQFFELPPPPVVKPVVKEVRYLSAPCGNPICPDFDPPVPRAHLEGRDPSDPLVISCPTCDFTYSQKAGCVTPQHRRVKKTGRIWENKLRELILSDVSVYSIQKQIGTSTPFIMQRALELGLWRPEWSDSSLRIANVQSRNYARLRKGIQRNREKWLELQKKNPTAGRTQLLKLDVSAHRYLRKNDLDWFESNSPALRADFGNLEPKDWEQIDVETAENVKVLAEEILEDDKPVRLTIAEISKRIDGPGLEARLQRLPRTKTLIDSLVETGEQYAARKSARSMRKYLQMGVLPSMTNFFISSHLDRRSKHFGICQKYYNALRESIKYGYEFNLEKDTGTIVEESE